MINFVPFNKSKKAQEVISDFINKDYEKPPALNPYYDLREEGQDFYPLNPPVTPVVDDPCPEGYQLIDGVCQPIEQFGGTTPDFNNQNNNDNDQEERPYFSIKEMENLSDEQLIDYLKQGYLTNSLIGFLPSKGNLVTVQGTPPNMLGFGLGLLGMNDSAIRKDAMTNELLKRGYFSGQYDEKGNQIFDIGQTPDNSYLFNPPASTNEAAVPYGGTTTVSDTGGSYGGGEDFGGGNYQGNVVINNQAIQKERDRINKVVEGMQSGQPTVFGGL